VLFHEKSRSRKTREEEAVVTDRSLWTHVPSLGDMSR
jgi:hypothetical protein